MQNIKKITAMFNLVKTIKSKSGNFHFKRFSIFSCRYFSIYIHKIYRSDEDDHPHNHPWNFVSIILSGAYKETLTKLVEDCAHFRYLPVTKSKIYEAGSILKRNADDYHKLKLSKPVTTLVITGSRINDDWGYLVDGKHISHEEYRRLKNAESQTD